MKFTSFAIALLAFAFSARPATVTYTPGTGVILYPENFFEANSNLIVQAIAGAFPGTGSGNASTNVAQGWSALQVFDDVTVTGTLDVGDLNADSFTTATPLGFASGGHGATNAAGARSALGVVIGTDVQSQSTRLQELADISYVSGDFVYYNGANLVRVPSTAAGRALLAAASATDARNQLVTGELDQSAYGAGWDGATSKVATLNALYAKIQSLPGGSNNISSWNTAYFDVTGGYLDWVGGSVGGGAGFVYILTNSLGAWQGRDTSTNWTILSTTISSNDLPTATGRFIEGGYSGILSNNSGTSATAYLNVLIGGTLVFSDSYSYASSGGARPLVADFRLVRESSTKASLVQHGGHVNSSTVTVLGLGDFGSSPTAATIVTTNITVDWTANLAFAVEVYCDTSTSTNEALGIRPVSAWMRRDATASSGTGDVVGPASSTTNNIAVFADATGKLLADGGVTVASLATEAEVAAGYEPLDANKYQSTNAALTALSGNPSLYQSTNANLTALSGAGSTGTGAFVRADSPTIAGTWAFDDFTANTINVLSNLYAVTVAYGAGWNGSSNVPTRNDVYDEMELRAPKASPALTGDPTAPTASANDNDTSIATTAYVQAEETALKAANLWQATNAALTALAGNPSLYQATNGNLTTLAGASITGAGNFMRTRTGVPRKIWIPASAMNPGSDAPTPATNAWNTTTDGQRWEGWDFSATATNSVYFLLALPTAWDAGTVKAKVVWKQVVAAATATNSWQIGGGSLTDGETGGNTLGTLVEVLDAGANDTNVVSVTAASGAITIGGTPSAGHMTWFTIRRHPGDTDDNYAELSRLIGLHLQYTETSTEPSAW